MQVCSPSIEMWSPVADVLLGWVWRGGVDDEGELHTYIYISSTKMCNSYSCIRIHPQHSYGSNNSVSLPMCMQCSSRHRTGSSEESRLHWGCHPCYLPLQHPYSCCMQPQPGCRFGVQWVTPDGHVVCCLASCSLVIWCWLFRKSLVWVCCL